MRAASSTEGGAEHIMQTGRRILGLTLALLIGSSVSRAAEPFTDVPRGHWAYDAIQRAVDAGILEGIDGKFHGDKLITRHQMAVIVAKMLDEIQRGGRGVASKLAPRDIANLEALTIEFADELALMNVKLSTLEDAFVELRNTVEALKAGNHIEHSPTLRPQFAGLLSIGLVSTDDGMGTTPYLTRYGAALDRFLFSVPQASLSLDMDLGHGVGTHVQFDYATDLPSTAAAAPVALNEAYLTWDNGPGAAGFRAGLMALPFQSWEYNGPQRTLMDTITPSALNGFWEAHRVVGLEGGKSTNQTADSWRWRAGVFTHNDLAGVIGAGPLGGGRVYGSILGTSSDAPVPGSGTAVLDDSPGFYLDLESGTSGNWGWRLGYFDVGGDNTANAPAISTNDWNGFQAGAWWRNSSFRLVFQGLVGQEDYGTGAANSDDLFTAFVLGQYHINDDHNVSFRYETWDVDNQGAGTGVGTGDRKGNTLTLAYNRKVTDTSLFQFEYLAPDENAPTGGSDTGDDLIQARYKVWW